MAANTALTEYSHAFKKWKAYEAICKDLKQSCQREINKAPEGEKVIIGGVEFHKTYKVEKSFPKIAPILYKLLQKIKLLKETAIQTGQFNTETTDAFDAEIPKSVIKQVLAKSTKDYAEHFGIK